MDRWLSRLPVLLVLVAAGLIAWLTLDGVLGSDTEAPSAAASATTEPPTTTLAPTTVPSTTVAATTLPPTTLPPTTLPPTTLPPTTTTAAPTTTSTAPWPVGCRNGMLVLSQDGGTLANAMIEGTRRLDDAAAGAGSWTDAIGYVESDVRYWHGVFAADIERSLAANTMLDDPVQWFAALDWQAYTDDVGAVLGEFEDLTYGDSVDAERWPGWRASWDGVLEDYGLVSARAGHTLQCTN